MAPRSHQTCVICTILYFVLISNMPCESLVMHAKSFITGGNGTATSPWQSGIERALGFCTIDCVVLVDSGHWVVEFMNISLGTSVIGMGWSTIIHHAPSRAKFPMGRLDHHAQLRRLVVNGSRFAPSVNTSFVNMDGGFTIVGDNVIVDSVKFVDFSAYGALCHCNTKMPAANLVVQNSTFQDCWVGFHSGRCCGCDFCL